MGIEAGARRSIEVVRKRPAAGEARIDFVPPAYLFFIGAPAEVDYAALSFVWEVHEAGSKVFYVNADEFDFLDGFAEGDQVGQVGGAERAAAAVFGFGPRAIKLGPQAHQRFALAGDSREQLSQPGYKAPRFAQRECSLFAFLLVHILSRA